MRRLTMILREYLSRTAKKLTDYGAASPEVEAELMACFLLKCSRAELLWRGGDIVPEAVVAATELFLDRRRCREPWQYIEGIAPFRNLELTVDRRVLIPRPETELLVDWVLLRIPRNGTLLDVGCGSGAIVLSCASERQDIFATGVDISLEALEVARINREKYALENVELLHSDLASAVLERKFDAVTANLPYVSEEEYAVLEPEVRNFEPRLALVAGENGLSLIHRLVEVLPLIINPSGVAIFEIGWQQGKLVRSWFEQLCADCLVHVEILQDYCGRDRFVAARFSGNENDAFHPLHG